MLHTPTNNNICVNTSHTYIHHNSSMHDEWHPHPTHTQQHQRHNINFHLLFLTQIFLLLDATTYIAYIVHQYISTHTYSSSTTDDLHSSSLIPQRVSQHHCHTQKYFFIFNSSSTIKLFPASCLIVLTGHQPHNPTTLFRVFSHTHINTASSTDAPQKIYFFFVAGSILVPHTHFFFVVGGEFWRCYFSIFRPLV